MRSAVRLQFLSPQSPKGAAGHAVYLLCRAFAVCLILAVTARGQEPADTVYDGKPASAWAADLKNPDRGVRERATRAVMKIGAPAVPHLVKVLEGSKDWQVRRGVLTAFLRMGKNAKAATPALLAALQGPDADERDTAAEALGRIGPHAKDAVPALIRALKDENHYVRSSSAAALGEIGAEADKVAPDKNETVRRYAAQSLARFGSRARAAVPALKAAANDAVPVVRSAAVNALKQIDPEAARNLPPAPAVPVVTEPAPARKNVRSHAPPSFVSILGFDKATGAITLAEFRVVQVPVFAEKAVQKNGKKETVRSVLYKPVTEQVRRDFRFEDVQFFGGDGKQLEKAKAMERLARGGMALLSADGNRVDERYLGLLRKDAFVLVVRHSAKQRWLSRLTDHSRPEGRRSMGPC
jgi:hypothetical protein